MNPNAQFERDLERWLQAEAPASAPPGLHATVIDRARTMRQRPGWATLRLARWFGRGRGLTLLAAGALLLVGGAMAAGSGLVKLPSLVPPVPAPTLAVVATPSPAVSPTPVATPRPAAVIAYINWVYRTGAPMVPTSRVWIVGADGTGAHELFPGGTGNQSGVAWSPDGTRLLYSENPGPGELPGKATVPGFYLTDASGSAPQAADPGCVAPACNESSAAFSPDGTKLVFLRNGNVTTPAPIATMDLASGRVVELGSTAAVNPERPRWSPDGKQIVFSRPDKFGNDAAVFIVDADGRNLHQLSAAKLPARTPDWSPDGSRIVFTSLVNKIVRVGGDNVLDEYQDVYTVRPDWTDLRRLTTEGFSGGATWTPDGRIMFTRQCTAQRPTGGGGSADCSASGLWTMDADGSNARLLVPGGNGIGGPIVGMFDAAWQPTP